MERTAVDITPHTQAAAAELIEFNSEADFVRESLANVLNIAIVSVVQI